MHFPSAGLHFIHPTQFLQEVLASGEKVPGGQVWHGVFLLVEKVPAGHILH